ncbi:MAG: HDOD domain-containing protein [Candidatus Angelobacter sp.]
MSVRESLLKKLEELDRMPTLPVSLIPLLRYMEQPDEALDLQQVIELISQDKSLAVQCLHMANSPLFGRSQTVGTIRDAVVALGLQRMRDIAVSCSMLSVLPSQPTGMDPAVLWEHSLGCALVCRQFARMIGFPDPGKAYLAGLLHDVGVVAHLWILPEQFSQAMELARNERIPLHEAELRLLEITHAETGKLVAERWRLPAEMISVVTCHHDPRNATAHRGLVALISLSDILCRMNGLGHGPVEDREVDFEEEPGFAILLEEHPRLRNFDWARFTFEMEDYMEEVHRLVNLMYHPA